MKNPKGLYYCGNPGCSKKVYDPTQNDEGSCQ